MSAFAVVCGLDGEARREACARLLQAVVSQGIQRVRIGWCDLHGALRGKTLMASALPDALEHGVGMVSTLMLKDSSDHTAYKVFEPGLAERLPGFGMANNLLLLPDPASFVVLPWADGTGWLRAMPHFADGTPVALDARRVLIDALARLAAAGYGLRCGLEVEFHIYRIESEPMDPMQAAWPGAPPAVSMLHPGYNLLSEAWTDRCDEALRIVQHTAQGLGLPLRSLEIELGPSQFEAVFDATDALSAADQMVLLRNGVAQALRRAGYLATFMCRPPFANIMSSGWHLHQSLVDAADGRNLMQPSTPVTDVAPTDAATVLSGLGGHWLAGLLAHAPGGSAFATPTINGYGRYGVNALAPQAVLWGRDNRGAMLRVLGGAGDAATRIENRCGEPLANPYLYIAAQVHAGLDGIARALQPPPATESPYAGDDRLLPSSLADALAALQRDEALCAAFGRPFVEHYLQVKQHELQRHAAAADKDDWQRREYFSRF